MKVHLLAIVLSAATYALLLAGGLLLVPLGLATRAYLVVAVALGTVYLVVGALGLRPGAGVRWARSLFLVSVLYMTALSAVLVVL